ncbi:sugar phosphate isomerase/epimerase [Ruminococcaceae bacterium OttesenSCG-928-L11]|nr:sugar phosphate isomerase/epimerase [Ruminococcaceae bacterium OttesenSCG-928-L11]
MKIGLSSYSMYGAMRSGEMSFLDIIQWIADNGADHMEVVSFMGDFLEDESLVKAVAEKTQQLGLRVSAYCTGVNVLAKDDAEAQFDLAFKHIDVAHKMGSKVMRCDLTSWDRPREEMGIDFFEKDLPALIEGSRRLADYAKQYDMIITAENHGMYMNGGERVRRLITGVDRDNYRCTLDVGNALCVDENPLVCIENLLPFAVAVHFKDFYIRRDADSVGEGFFITTPRGYLLRGAIVGHGDVDVALIAKTIRESGYDGDLAVEFEGLEDCKTGSRIGMDNLRRLMGMAK